MTTSTGCGAREDALQGRVWQMPGIASAVPGIVMSGRHEGTEVSPALETRRARAPRTSRAAGAGGVQTGAEPPLASILPAERSEGSVYTGGLLATVRQGCYSSCYSRERRLL